MLILLRVLKHIQRFISRLRYLPQNRSIAMQRFDSIHIPEATDGQQLQNLHK